MDVSPPQAPPAIIQGAQEEAVAALGRLVDTQQWLTEQEASLPPLPAHPNPAARHAFLYQHIAFWDASIVSAPGAARADRWAVFGQRMLGVMRDEATLRRLDGTLSERAHALVTAFARAPESALPTAVHARELTFGNDAYAGALVLTRDDLPDLALLFMPGRGWEEYTDLSALYRATEQNIRMDLVRGIALPGVAADVFDTALDGPFVASREVHGSFVDSQVRRVIALQQQRIDTAWNGLVQAPDDDGAERYLADHIVPLQRVHPYLDIHALLTARNVRLVRAVDDERLRGVPDDVADAWRSARTDYAVTTRVAERQRMQHGLDDAQSLDTFVRNGLTSRLKAQGIELDLDNVVVDVHDFTRAYFHNPTGRVDAAYLGPVRERLTLAQVALRNAGFLDNDLFIARDADGTALDTLPSGAVHTLVREFDAASAYGAYLAEVLQASTQGQQTQAIAASVSRARMRFDAEDARLGYFLTDEPRSFADDQAFRGYAWINAVLDSPASAGRRKVDGHDIVVRQLYYKGVPLKDVLAVGVRDERSVSRVVLYTPDAPDGIAFREFDSRAGAERGFLNQPAFEAYLLDRLPAEFARATNNGAERHFHLTDGEQQFRWVFSLGNAQGTKKTHAFEDRIVSGSFLDALYDTSLALLRRNVLAVARPTAHADVDNLPLRVDTDALGRGIAGLIGRPFQAGWRAYDRVREGDHAGAFVDAVDAYVASLDFLAVGAMKPLLARALPVRAGQTSRQIIPTRQVLVDPTLRFDDRFIAQGMSVRHADSVKDGVYQIGGRPFVEQKGKLYGVRKDGQTWRLRHPDSATYAPHIGRNAHGEWGHIGLHGGGDPHPFRGYIPPNHSDLAELTFHQRRVFEQTLVARAGMHEARGIVRRVRDGPIDSLLSELTPAQELHWHAAVRTARLAPALRPPVAPPAAAVPLAAAAAATPPSWAPPTILQELAPAQWPATLWYYPSRREFFPLRTPQNLVLPQSVHDTAGVMGLGAMSLGPNTPWPTLNAALGGPTLVSGQAQGAFEWVSINLTALSARVDAAGRPAFRVFLIRNGSNVNYLIRQVAAAEQTLWLRNGDFDAGVRVLPLPDFDGAVAGPSRAPNLPPRR